MLKSVQDVMDDVDVSNNINIWFIRIIVLVDIVLNRIYFYYTITKLILLSNKTSIPNFLDWSTMLCNKFLTFSCVYVYVVYLDLQ